MDNNPDDRSKHYNDSSFWDKVKTYAIAAGKGAIEKALTLYYCLMDSDTPAWARTVIISALGYFILPIDAIPDVIPIAGYSDDLGVLVSALAIVTAHIKSEHSAKAKEKLEDLFGKND